jgi:hypothetical protein
VSHGKRVYACGTFPHLGEGLTYLHERETCHRGVLFIREEVLNGRKEDVRALLVVRIATKPHKGITKF